MEDRMKFEDLQAWQKASNTYVILDNNLAPCDADPSLPNLASEVSALIFGLMRSTKTKPLES